MAIDACMHYSQIFKDAATEELQQAAEEKKCFIASKKELDERVEEMACGIATMKVIYSIGLCD